MKIHPTAVVDPGAELGEDVEIGPYCVIGPKVNIGARTRLLNHVTIMGPTTIGTDNIVYPYAVLGTPPQDFKYRGTDTELIIGHHNVFREGITANRGTEVAGGKTVIGSHNFLMAYCHVAHDSILEDRILIANNTVMGGHTKVESDASISGAAGIHHFVTIGEKSFVSGLSRVTQDVPPYMLAEGIPADVRCVNTVGLRRKGMASEAIQALKEAHRIIWRAGHPRPEALSILESNGHCTAEVRKLIGFLKAVEKGEKGRAREALRTW